MRGRKTVDSANYSHDRIGGQYIDATNCHQQRELRPTGGLNFNEFAHLLQAGVQKLDLFQLIAEDKLVPRAELKMSRPSPPPDL